MGTMTDASARYRLVVVLALLNFGADSRAMAQTDGAGQPAVLTGWGGGKADDVVPRAARIGFSELVVHHDDAANFRQFIDLGRRHGIDVYAWLYLGDLPAWRKLYPQDPPPLQVMTPEEDLALERFLADKTPGKSGYQFGGEPVHDLEVLITPLLCFHDPRVMEVFSRQIDEMLAFSGVRGVAFDYIGYRNYRCCHCPTSQRELAAYRSRHPDLDAATALTRFSLESLVDFSNRLSGHVRQAKPEARVITHVYPVFLAEPLYGNRLDVDVCGQTAAWYFEPYWSIAKITSYSRVICGDAKRYHPRAEGAGLIGYGKYPVKPPDRVAAELQAILDGGCRRVHVCSLNDVIRNPEAAEVFARFFGPAAAGAQTAGNPPASPADVQTRPAPATSEH